MGANVQVVKSNTGKSQQAQFRDQEKIDLLDIEKRMKRVKHKILVLSGKGGVGKSSVSVNLAASLAMSGYNVGLLDIDIHGPSVPQMLALTGQQPNLKGNTIIPVSYKPNLKVMSIGFLLPGRDDAVIWRGPLKMKMIKQFLKDVDWGDLDYLIVDSPPGTGDEPMSIGQLLPKTDGAVIVTTPQQVSISDVRRSIRFCHSLSIKPLGVIENMSGFVCPSCGDRIDLFKTGGGAEMAKEMNVPFLGSIPIDKAIVDSCDAGEPFVYEHADTEAGKAFSAIVSGLIVMVKEKTEKLQAQSSSETIRIALPLANGRLCAHFGHCESFALIDVNTDEKTITDTIQIPSPGHQPGFFPKWLHEHGVNLIITGGMGQKAIDLFNSFDIKVILGAQEDNPENLVQSYLDGSLIISENVCDHDEHSFDQSEHKCRH